METSYAATRNKTQKSGSCHSPNVRLVCEAEMPSSVRRVSTKITAVTQNNLGE